MTGGLVISNKHLRKTAILYMALPLFVFYCGFLRWYYSLLCCTALLYVVWHAVSKQSEDAAFGRESIIGGKTVCVVFLFTLLWSYLGGMNGYYYQSSDWNCRNAVYFDLIQFDWPVIYTESGGALVYYIGHWLPPALLAKAVLWITGSMRWARFMGRLFLWGWSSLGLTIIILLLFCALHAEKGRQRIAVVCLFVFFSGLDLLGAISNGRIGYVTRADILHLEWWCSGYQFTSVTACLFWVFNQAIIPWMITLCFLQEGDPRNYIFYCVACLLCGPLPCVGLVILMLVKAGMFLARSWREGELRQALKKTFSPANMAALLFLFPVTAAYILANNAAAGGDSAAAARSGFFSGDYLNLYLARFLTMEVGLYMLFVFADHWKDPLFYAIGLTFLVVPYFHVGVSYDFCMRASIPAIFVLMIYVSRFLLEHFSWPFIKDTTGKRGDRLRRVSAWGLAVCFAIGMGTPLMELYRGAYHVAKSKTVFLEDRSLMTFNTQEVPYNFGCDNPEEQFFFRYFAKEE